MLDTIVVMNFAIYMIAGWLTLTVWKSAAAAKMRNEMDVDQPQQWLGYALLMSACLILGWPIISLATIADLAGQGSTSAEKIMQLGILAGWLVLAIPAWVM